MKKQLGSLFCLLVFNYVAIGQANIYHPFPQCYAEWTVSSTSVLGNSYYNYYLSGDTIVNGYRHSKVYVAYDSVTSYFDAAIMEDNNKHIYACCDMDMDQETHCCMTLI